MTQIELSDAQAIILSTACAREDGAVFPVTATLKGGAVGNVCKSLLKRALIEEIPATDLNTVYRHDEERGALSLHATQLAYKTLGITESPEQQPDEPTETASAATHPARYRTGTKQDALIKMLKRSEGATIEEIASALHWRDHTVRGAMSGAIKKKLGLTITSHKADGRGRVYQIKTQDVG